MISNFRYSENDNKPDINLFSEPIALLPILLTYFLISFTYVTDLPLDFPLATEAQVRPSVPIGSFPSNNNQVNIVESRCNIGIYKSNTQKCSAR